MLTSSTAPNGIRQDLLRLYGEHCAARGPGVTTHADHSMIVCVGDGASGASESLGAFADVVEDLTGRRLTNLPTVGASEVEPGVRLFFLEEVAGAHSPFAVRSGGPDETPTVAVRGELDRANVPAVRREAEARIAGGASRLVLDLSETTFMDAAGLRLIGDLDDRLAAQAGRLVLVISPGPVERVFGLVAPPETVEVRRAFTAVPSTAA